LAKLAYCVVGSDARFDATTQTRVRRGPKQSKPVRKRVKGSRFQAVFGCVDTDREPGVRPRKMTGGQSSL
jgi:hypothetical protein